MHTGLKAAALIILLVVVSRLCVAVERIWDNELRRYLTEAELEHAEVFMSEDDAVKLMLPKSQRIRRELIRLTHEKKELIEVRIGWKFPEESFEVYIGETGDKVDGYAMIHNTIGKHRHMTYMVGVDAEGRCIGCRTARVSRSKRKRSREKRFNSQYEGKTVSDPIRINKDIINICGATMSVRSISAGVKRVLVLVDEFYLKPRGLGSETVASRKAEKGFFGSIFGN